MTDIINIFILTSIGSFLGLTGGILFLYKKSWSAWLSEYSIPFAAGILLTVSLAGLLPEAVDMIGETAFTVTLLTLIGAFLFEHFLFGIHHHEESHHEHYLKEAVPLVVVGDTIHNFIDGVAIAATYLANPAFGLITSLSTLLHEIPHEIGDFGILLKAKWKNKNIIFVNVVSAGATLVGALALLIVGQNDAVVGFMLAFSAGLFLYIGASDFLPETIHPHADKKALCKPVIALLVGVGIMLSAFTLIPHGHEKNSSATTSHGQPQYHPEN